MVNSLCIRKYYASDLSSNFHKVDNLWQFLNHYLTFSCGTRLLNILCLIIRINEYIICTSWKNVEQDNSVFKNNIFETS